MNLEDATFISVEGLSIRRLNGPERTGVPLVLTSPWPESLFAFHKIWARVTQAATVIAIDLPGFGQSEGRPDLMSPTGMAQFIPRILSALDLERVHAVGPDIGTSAFLFAASRTPAVFESVVVGSGATAVETAGGSLRDLILAPDLSRFDGQDGADVGLAAVKRMMQGVVSPGILADYGASSAGRRFAEAASYVRAYPRDLPILAETLPSINTPVLSLWGANDPIVPPENARILSQRLPRTQAVHLDAGHFAWEDQADAYADALLDWVAGGYRAI